MKEANQILLGIFFFFMLGLHSSAQSVLEGGKIPKDLVIILSLTSTSQFAAEYDYKITSDERVFFEDRSQLFPSSNLSILFNSTKNKLKKTKLKNRLSKKQLKKIITELEESQFFEMGDYYQGDPTFKEGVCVNHADTKGLSISAHGKTKRVAFFLGCGYGDKSQLKSFLSLYDKINRELSGVKKKNLKNQQVGKNQSDF